MTIPLLVLGFLSLTAGWVVYNKRLSWAGGHMDWVMPTQCVQSFLGSFLTLEGKVEAAGLGHKLEIINVLLALGAFAFTYFFYGRAGAQDPVAAKAPGLYHVLERHGWFDNVYDWYVAKVQQRVCDILALFDLLFIKLIGGQGTAGVAGVTGYLLRRAQVGSIHAYVYWFLGGVLLFWAYAAGWL